MTRWGSDSSNDPTPPAALPTLARRAIALALLRYSDTAIALHPAPTPLPDPWRIVNLDYETVTDDEGPDRLVEWARRARERGATAPLVRIGEQDPAAAVLASGDHIWKLVTLGDELMDAVEALACALVTCMSAADREQLARQLDSR